MDEKKILLVVEDDPGLQKQFKWSFDAYQTIIAGNRTEAITALRRHEPQVVTLDLGLPPDPTNASEGLKTLAEILTLAPATKVIVVTGNDDRDNAITAVAMGAYDFYQKPVDIDVLDMIITRAFHLYELEQVHLRNQKSHNEPLAGIIASCPQMQELSRTVEKIAPTRTTTMLLGESGTGKEVIARAIHALSDRADMPFIAVNCAAIPENLLESELFGYERGAFTGASQQTKGKIEYANKGTFFLDEIGDLPINLQAKLLRFLQERTIERIGGRQEIPIDVRVVCATHQNLQTFIDDGRFRHDLYYRLSEFTINIPPLRDRQGDAVVIAQKLLKRFSDFHNKKLKGFSPEAIHAIENYGWPGNVRELENRINRAVIVSTESTISPKDLELNNEAKQIESASPFNLKEVREIAETMAIKRALSHTLNNVSNTAKLLGISRPTLYSLLTKYGIQVDEA